MYKELDDKSKKFFTTALSGENKWPNEEFKKQYLEYFDMLDRVGRACMKCMALSLGMCVITQN